MPPGPAILCCPREVTCPLSPVMQSVRDRTSLPALTSFGATPPHCTGEGLVQLSKVFQYQGGFRQQSKPQTLTWPSVVTQHRHQHRPSLQKVRGPKHGTLWQSRPGHPHGLMWQLRLSSRPVSHHHHISSTISLHSTRTLCFSSLPSLHNILSFPFLSYVFVYHSRTPYPSLWEPGWVLELGLRLLG